MKLSNTTLTVLNTITFANMLGMNYAANKKIFTQSNVAEVAHKYNSLFAPADYAFIIWSIIFLLCTCFIIYEWALIKNDKQQYIQCTGLWFAVSNIANGLWCYCWVHEWLGSSVVLILILLFSLFMLTIKLKLELYDEPVFTILFWGTA